MYIITHMYCITFTRYKWPEITIIQDWIKIEDETIAQAIPSLKSSVTITYMYCIKNTKHKWTEITITQDWIKIEDKTIALAIPSSKISVTLALIIKGLGSFIKFLF